MPERFRKVDASSNFVSAFRLTSLGRGILHPPSPCHLVQIWPRSQAELSGLTPWQDRMQSWCDGADPVCAGGNSVAAHGAYMNQKQEIADWIREMVGV